MFCVMLSIVILQLCIQKINIQIEYNKDNFGLRGRKNKINEIDILTVGGSTTDERYINLENTWAEKLENLFIKKVKFILMLLMLE